MRKKVNKHANVLKDIKKNLVRGDLDLIYVEASKQDASITSAQVYHAFQGNNVKEENLAIILRTARKIERKRIKEYAQ